MLLPHFAIKESDYLGQVNSQGWVTRQLNSLLYCHC